MTTTIWTEECVLCSRRPNDGNLCPQVCTWCRGRIRTDLADIPRLYARLTQELIPGASHGPKISGTRELKVPTNLDVLNLRSRGGPGAISRWMLEEAGAPTEHLADQHGSIPVAGILVGLEREVRESLGYSRATFHGSVEQTVKAITEWLLRMLERICDAYPAMEELVADVGAIHSECRRIVAETPAKFGVGECPMAGEDGEPCGSPRSVDPYSDAMRCPGCGTTWRRWEWMEIAVMLGEGA
jgi:hypothetical protein